MLHSRSEELSLLEKLLVNAEPSPQFVEVSGERWSGKTTLVNSLVEVGRARGWVVAAGCSTAQQPGVRFGIFIDALDPLLNDFRRDLVGADLADCRQWLGNVFPALATSPAQARPLDPTEMYYTFCAARRLLEAFGSLGDLLLVLDDLHSADQDSVDLLKYLVRHPPKGKIVIAVAGRPRKLDPTLRQLLDEAATRGRAHRLELAALPDERARTMAPEHLSATQCADLLRESRGNPGLILGFGSTWASIGELKTLRQPLPDDVMDRCQREFRGLSELALLVLRSAAVLMEPIEPAMLARVVQRAEHEIWAAVDELIAEDLLVPKSSLRRLWFANELLRAAAYQSAGMGWLRGAHSRAMGELVARGASGPVVANHLERCASVGDNASADILAAVAKDRLYHNPQQAASLAAATLEVRAGSDAYSFGGPLLLAQALALAGRLRESSRILEELCSSQDRSSRLHAEATHWRSWVLTLLGQPELAHAELTASLDRGAGLDGWSRSLLTQSRLQLALRQDARIEGIDESIVEFGGREVPPVVCGFTQALLAAAVPPTSPVVLPRVETAAARFDEAADDEIAEWLDGLHWLAVTECRLSRVEDALRHSQRGLRIAELRGLRSRVPDFAIVLGKAQLSQGDLRGAMRHAACAEAAAALMASEPLLAAAAMLMREIMDRDRSAVPQVPAPRTEEPQVVSLSALSVRELEIAVLVSCGRTNYQIARKLDLSHKTVETYLGRIFKKLIVSSRAEVAAMVGRSQEKFRMGDSMEHSAAWAKPRLGAPDVC